MTLNNKQRAFVEHYLVCWNASEAARRAGYSAKTAGSQGYDLLKKPEVSRAIQDRLSELSAGAQEVIARLTDHARVSLEDYIDEQGNIDIAAARKAHKLHLLKSYKKTKRYFKGELVEESIEVTPYDAQAANVWLGKHHKLFTEQHEHSGKVEVEYVNDWRK